jgi:hypothetical protein
MQHKKNKNKSDNATRTSVGKELRKPRMTRSPKIAELNLDTTRIPERPRPTVPGTVEKILPFRLPSKLEKAQIAVEAPDKGYRDLRIENTLTDEHGDDVKLKKGAHVDVTVTAEPEI